MIFRISGDLNLCKAVHIEYLSNFLSKISPTIIYSFLFLIHRVLRRTIGLKEDMHLKDKVYGHGL